MYDLLGPSGGVSALISSVKEMKTECDPKTTPTKPKKGKEVQDSNYVMIGELHEGPIHVYTYRVIDDSTGDEYFLFNMNLIHVHRQKISCQKLYEILKCSRMAAVIPFYGTNVENEYYGMFHEKPIPLSYNHVYCF